MVELSRSNFFTYVVAFTGYFSAVLLTGSILTIEGLGFLDGLAVSNIDQFIGYASIFSGSIILLGGIGGGIYMVANDFRATFGEKTSDETQ